MALNTVQTGYIRLIFSRILSSLNLPAALEDMSGDKVPQSVLEKAQQTKDMGGLQHIDKLMSELPELLTRNREILEEVKLTHSQTSPSFYVCGEQIF